MYMYMHVHLHKNKACRLKQVFFGTRTVVSGKWAFVSARLLSAAVQCRWPVLQYMSTCKTDNVSSRTVYLTIFLISCISDTPSRKGVPYSLSNREGTFSRWYRHFEKYKF